ncbi:MAG: hypothetical protein ACLRWQ_21945 [Flavonifractor plautii]
MPSSPPAPSGSPAAPASTTSASRAICIFDRRAGRGPVPAGALLWGGPEQRAGPHCLVRAVLRRLPGTPMAIQFWQKAWTAWITPAVDTIPLQLGYYLAILLSCLVGVALLMSVKPLCWLFTGQSFSSACRECNLFALFRRNPSKQTPAS